MGGAQICDAPVLRGRILAPTDRRNSALPLRGTRRDQWHAGDSEERRGRGLSGGRRRATMIFPHPAIMSAVRRLWWPGR